MTVPLPPTPESAAAAAALIARAHHAAMHTNDGDAGRSLLNELAAALAERDRECAALRELLRKVQPHVGGDGSDEEGTAAYLAISAALAEAQHKIEFLSDMTGWKDDALAAKDGK